LYDLLTADSTPFLITFKGDDFLTVDNALINIQRQYVSDGLFRSVEIPKTDASGQAVAHLVADEVVYTIIVSKDGIVLGTFNNVVAICDDVVALDCIINLNVASATLSIDDFSQTGGISYNIGFNEDTKTITTIFTTTDGSTKTVLLNATKYDRFGNTTICSDILTSSAGTLTCTIPDSFGNVTVISKLFSDGEEVKTNMFRITETMAEAFGESYGTAIICALIMIITLPLMFIASLGGVLFGLLMGVIAALLLIFLSGGSLISETGAFIWFVIAIGIVLWKISERRTG